MSQAEGPEAEVGGCVGDAAQAVLNRVDGLMHKDVSKVELKERSFYTAHSVLFYMKSMTKDIQMNETWALGRHFQLN